MDEHSASVPAALPEAVSDAEAIASIGEKIRDLRKLKRLTLARVAEATGLSIGHLSQVERGISAPSVRHLQLIAAALGVKISWFFDGGDPAPAAQPRHKLPAAEGGSISLASASPTSSSRRLFLASSSC